MKKLILSMLVAGLLPLSVQADDLEFSPFPMKTGGSTPILTSTLMPSWSSGLVVSPKWADYSELVGITQNQPGQRLPFKSTQVSGSVDLLALFNINGKQELTFKGSNWPNLFKYNVGTKGKCPDPYITWMNGKLIAVNPCSDQSG